MIYLLLPGNFCESSEFHISVHTEFEAPFDFVVVLVDQLLTPEILRYT